MKLCCLPDIGRTITSCPRANIYLGLNQTTIEVASNENNKNMIAKNKNNNIVVEVIAVNVFVIVCLPAILPDCLSACMSDPIETLHYYYNLNDK